MFRAKIRRLRTWVQFLFYRETLNRQVIVGNDDYRSYLETQLKRTLSKKGSPLQKRTELLVDRLDQVHRLNGKRILAVGPRNAVELDYLQSKGVERVTGIDLFSDDPRILVMDMHHMDFADDTFDVTYSSHSLEHAQDVKLAAHEFVRVTRNHGVMALEVPVRYRTRGADLVDIESLEGLCELFAPHVGEILWSDEQPAHSAENSSGTPIVRTILTIRKARSVFYPPEM